MSLIFRMLALGLVLGLLGCTSGVAYYHEGGRIAYSFCNGQINLSGCGIPSQLSSKVEVLTNIDERKSDSGTSLVATGNLKDQAQNRGPAPPNPITKVAVTRGNDLAPPNPNKLMVTGGDLAPPNPNKTVVTGGDLAPPNPNKITVTAGDLPPPNLNKIAVTGGDLAPPNPLNKITVSGSDLAPLNPNSQVPVSEGDLAPSNQINKVPVSGGDLAPSNQINKIPVSGGDFTLPNPIKKDAVSGVEGPLPGFIVSEPEKEPRSRTGHLFRNLRDRRPSTPDLEAPIIVPGEFPLSPETTTPNLLPPVSIPELPQFLPPIQGNPPK